MLDPTNPLPQPKPRNRETTVLVLVALVGLAGLGLLLFGRKGPADRAANRSMVQSGTEPQTIDPTKVKTIQRIPGNLISVNEQPEAGRPFLFKMANFAQGAIYELDLGDGHRKAFVNGVLKHTYPRPGPFRVILFARYEGQEVAIDSLTKIVAQAVKQEEVAPIIDY